MTVAGFQSYPLDCDKVSVVSRRCWNQWGGHDCAKSPRCPFIMHNMDQLDPKRADNAAPAKNINRFMELDAGHRRLT